jgi:hypothetical protein
MSDSLIFRIIIDIIIFIAALTLPWWTSILLALFFLFYFSSFYEILAVGFILDCLYAQPQSWLFHFNFALTLLCIIVFLISIPLKRSLSFYKS